MSEETNALSNSLDKSQEYKPVAEWMDRKLQQLKGLETPLELTLMLLELDVVARELTRVIENIQTRLPEHQLKAIYGAMLEMPVLYDCYGGAKRVEQKATQCGLGKFSPVNPSTKASYSEKQLITSELIRRIQLAKFSGIESHELLQEYYFPKLPTRILDQVLEIDLSASSTWEIAKLLTDIVTHSDINDAPRTAVIQLAISQIESQLRKRKTKRLRALEKKYPKVEGERDALAETHYNIERKKIEAMTHSRKEIEYGITEFFDRQLKSHFRFSEKKHLPQKSGDKG